MTSTTSASTVTEERRARARVPLVEGDGIFSKLVCWYSRRTYGEVLDSGLAMLHNRKVLRSVMRFEMGVARWDRLDPDLKTLAQLASASAIGCSWCMDFGYYAAHSAGLDTGKLGEVPRWRESSVFDERGVRAPEVFGFGYDEIATATDRSRAAVRQIASRARNHVQPRRPRVAAPEPTEEITARFLEAATGGELQPLLDLLAPDVVLLSDGGGKKRAALRPLHGAEKVARWLLGVMRREADVEYGVEWSTVNGHVAVLLHADGVLDSVGAVVAESGRVREIYLVRNPDKLRRIAEVRQVSR